MLRRNRLVKWRSSLSAVAVCVLMTAGCQTWKSSSAIPGMSAKKSEREALRQAKHDPFPSPSQVGMQETK